MRDTSARDWRYVNKFISFKRPLRIGACATVVRSAAPALGSGVFRLTLNCALRHGCIPGSGFYSRMLIRNFRLRYCNDQ
jgi:hypothetical protein